MRLLRKVKIKTGSAVMPVNGARRDYFKIKGVFVCPSCRNTRVLKVSVGLRMKRCGCVSNSATHGLSRTKLYQLWKKIRERCYNPKASSFKDYGAKGITVCWAWRHNPSRFVLWASRNGWSPNLTIDRKDYRKGYSPGNCRFVSLSFNSRYTRRTKLTLADAREIRRLFECGTMTKKAMANHFSVSRRTIYHVICGNHWKEGIEP